MSIDLFLKASEFYELDEIYANTLLFKKGNLVMEVNVAYRLFPNATRALVSVQHVRSNEISRVTKYLGTCTIFA